MKLAPLFLIFLFAGCTEPVVPEPQVIEPQVLREPDIFGFVLDENGTKINATILITPSLQETQSINGSFAFYDVPKDLNLHLTAFKDGHRNSTANIRLSENLAAQIVFTLPKLSSLPPQSVVTEFTGVFSCKIQPAAPCPFESEERYASYTSYAPSSDLNHTQTVAELYWTPAELEPQTMQVTIEENGVPIFQEDVSPGWKWTQNNPASQYTFQFQPSGPISFTLNQEFELFVTHFYNKPGPEGYSILQ